ncbi:MAG: VOC family protein [Gracilibacteraceae bacterium]|jgi:catechol 2,3-dioxygenase-like lactoylglutathione lyase family enzyme|nr:VOC family protein [Gracilibacteraceae bacterium]
MNQVVPMEIGIVVSDMDCMINFYTRVLGLELISDLRSDASASAKVGTTPNGYRIVRMKTNYGDRVKMVRTDGDVGSPPAPPAWVYERMGICYLTFVVSDMADIIAALKANNVKMLCTEAYDVRPGVNCLNIVDPEGNFVEFVQYADVKSYRPELFQ